MDMHGKTREEAVLLLLSLQDRIGLLVQRRQLGSHALLMFFALFLICVLLSSYYC